jgi:protein-disulfide isomerase
MGTIAIAVLVLAAIIFIPQLRGAGPGATAGTSELDLAAQPRLGDADAPVEIILFEDFRCPSCGRFTEQVFPQIEQEFVNDGTAHVYFVNFPVLGAASRHVALVTECVAAQSEEAFWDLKRPLMRSQGELEDRNRVYELVSTYAPDVDMDQVRTCVDEEQQVETLDAEIQATQRLGVSGTPTVFVNGVRVESDFASIRNAVERAAE